jgi:hypothetical protein
LEESEQGEGAWCRGIASQATDSVLTVSFGECYYGDGYESFGGSRGSRREVVEAVVVEKLAGEVLSMFPHELQATRAYLKLLLPCITADPHVGLNWLTLPDDFPPIA